MQPQERLSPFWAITIVFLSNFCILVIELVAGRIMAPIVGVSLYTWTSIIGVVLAGISLGNYLGGKIADRYASRNTLALSFALSALGSVSVLGILEWIGPLQRLELPLIASILLIFAAVFLIPATILGVISPIVVKLTLVDLNQTGDVVGKLYAAGALGSIAGTFATGFFLISTFGTRAIVWGVAGSLLLIGAMIALSGRGWLRYSLPAIFGAFLALSGLAQQQGWLNSDCLRETNYFCIKVRLDAEDENIRILTLDRLVHSYVDASDPTHLRYGYEQIYAEVLHTLFPAQEPVAAFFIGGGGYTFPRYIEVVLPGSRLEVVEIDPGVTEVAYAHLGLPADTTIDSYNEDARSYLIERATTGQYDLIVGDAFNDFSVPYHLTTLEFNQLVRAQLDEEGIYMVNIIDGRRGDFLRAYVHTLQQTFDHVYVATTVGDVGAISRQTYVVVATVRSLDQMMGRPPLDQHFLPAAELAAYLEAGPIILLTDDYVPVDNLLAPVFTDPEG
ncbi:MAG TPA: fused MFS/spermidine synthase [Anaerolineae bacterium]|nr:fused MFS/spermidine synthase [Anaerolineae bacterium]